MGVIALVLLQSLAMALFTVFSRPLAVKLNRAQFQVTAVIFSGLYLCALPIAFLISDITLADLARWWPCVLAVSLAFGLQNVGLFWVLRYMDAALSSLLGTLGIIATVILATIILGEGLTLRQVAGALLIIGSISYVLAAPVNQGERRHWTIGLIISSALAVLLALGATGEKYLLGKMELGSYLVWGWGMQWLVILLISLIYLPDQYKLVLKRSNAKPLTLATIFRTLGALGFVAGQLIIGNLSKVAVSSGLKVLFVAILGITILHERQFIRRKLIAAASAAVGVAVMFW
jgi:hypothetical protein